MKCQILLISCIPLTLICRKQQQQTAGWKFGKMFRVHFNKLIGSTLSQINSKMSNSGDLLMIAVHILIREQGKINASEPWHAP